MIATLLLLLSFAAPPAEPVVWLDELNLTEISQDWGGAHARRSMADRPLHVAGSTSERGVGTHANSVAIVDLHGGVESFTARVGVDDDASRKASIAFRIVVDGKMRFESPVMHHGDAALPISINGLRGSKRLELHVTDAGDGIDSDHADWMDARFTLVSGARTRPQIVNPISNDRPRIASTVPPPEPQIHGPRIVGTTPNRPFLFLVPATGEAPLRFEADSLPPGISLDPITGILHGTVTVSGRWSVKLRVTNARGEATRTLRIVAGDHQLALTPPMGWNSWNVWGTSVDAAKVRAAADALISSGLAAHGYAYVNIDDAWQGTRDSRGEIRANDRFGDISALAEHVHTKGLKLGIYSSPGPKTCAGYEGSAGHEMQDAQTWARWGVDYVKHDWCSCTSEQKQAPYELMRRALDRTNRDIVYSLCQYGMADVWTWASSPAVRGNLWRTTGDITDSWNSMSSIGFKQPDIARFAGPGHWNDPDMLVVCVLGWGPNVRPTRLKPIEQQTHITLWAMCAAPLLIGCDLTRLDDFTRDLLCNDEVLDVDQDPLGRAATRVKREGETEVWARPLEDGTVAVAMFNRGSEEAVVTAKWSDIGRAGEQPVRDLWQRQSLGVQSDEISKRIPAHGSALLKVGEPEQDK